MKTKEVGNKGCAKHSFADLVLSVLPWPFHRDLPIQNCEVDAAEKTFDNSEDVAKPKLKR